MTLSKRLLDLGLALLLLVVGMPLLLGLAGLILLRDGRPVLYLSERMTTPQRGFLLWKFRTMRPDGADRGVSGGDKADRITRTGHFLRRYRLDELPQLWNILVGDMSLVGPRPYTPPQRRMHALPELYESLRPGLTGFWQIGPRGEGSDFALRAVEDARYWRELSLGVDLQVILRTAAIVAKGAGR